jgi:urea carboxylase
MRGFGLKHEAKKLAAAAGVPLLPGTDLLELAIDAQKAALQIGLPVMLKSTAGGGGIGMTLCQSAESVVEAFDSVRRLSENNFKQGGIFLEKYVNPARHTCIEDNELFGLQTRTSL